jgi:hypothetical protein
MTGRFPVPTAEPSVLGTNRAVSVSNRPKGHRQPIAQPPMLVRIESPYPQAQHLNQIDLARRWRISPRTLERWRWLHQGPAYLKIGGRVAYRLEDVEMYEAAQRR